MALRQPIEIGPEWVNIYTSATPQITVGTQVIAHVLSARSRVTFSDSAAEPTSTDGKVSIALGDFYQNDNGDLGFWARCATNAQITIQES